MKYLERRKDLHYYKKCIELIDQISLKNMPQSIIDIGGWNGFFIKDLSIKEKVCLDKKVKSGDYDDVKYIEKEFLKWDADKQYDIVLCMQVLEHLNDKEIHAFTEKLFQIGKSVIISIPYKWRKGWCKNHKQDPVDYTKLKSWTKRNPFESYLVKDKGVERLICHYKEDYDS